VNMEWHRWPTGTSLAWKRKSKSVTKQSVSRFQAMMGVELASGDKEKRIYDLKKKNQELEKFK
jgi:hypothetical protein